MKFTMENAIDKVVKKFNMSESKAVKRPCENNFDVGGG